MRIDERHRQAEGVVRGVRMRICREDERAAVVANASSDDGKFSTRGLTLLLDDFVGGFQGLKSVGGADEVAVIDLGPGEFGQHFVGR